MSQNKETPRSGRTETGAALAVGFICLVVGVPLWWRTTTTYRASLPYADINQVFQKETACIVPITVVSCLNPETTSQAHLDGIKDQLMRLLHIGEGDKYALDIQYSVYPRQCLKTERQAIKEASSMQDLDDRLSNPQTSSVGNIEIYILQDTQLLQDILSRVYVGHHRAIYLKLDQDSTVSDGLEIVTPVLKSVLVSEENLNKHYKTARGIVHTVADLESMRSFRYTPGYELSFTLLLPEPHNMVAHWNFDQAQKVFLDPLLDKLREFAEFTVASQVLYYTGLSVKPKYSSKQGFHYFAHSSLPHIITPVEAKLGSHVTNFPNLNFLVYIPPMDQSPLYILSSDGNPVDTNAFLSPRWGGVLIHNTPDLDKNATQPTRVTVDNDAVMPVFLSQLRLLLGVPNPVQTENVFLAQPGEKSINDWEYDSLLRKHCIENLATASASLFSLSQLLEKISNIVIDDDIAKQVYIAVDSIKSSHRLLRDGKLNAAFHSSKRAVIASEKAFFDPSLLQLLYFPDDQKFAIYIPLFLPISIPVLISLVKAFKWMQNKKDEKDKMD